jgi:hypothetical protein
MRLGRSLPYLIVTFLLVCVPDVAAQQDAAPRAPVARVPSPEAVLGFRVGEPGRIATWDEVHGYFRRLAAASDHVSLEEIGRSVLGRPMLMAVITSPGNHGRLEEIRAGQARVADPRGAAASELARLTRTQPVVLFVGTSIHGSEIMGSQLAMELAWEMATDSVYRGALQDVVVLLAPSLNPDGVDITRDWYLRVRGTDHAQAPMPWLYHVFAGHDNNRDFYMMTQPETRAVSRVLYERWFPNVVWDVHQMGADGERYFIPPFADPLNPNIDPLLVRLTNLLGVQIAADMTAAGLTGISHRHRFDFWWHGGARSTPARHNMVTLLSESASALYGDSVYRSPGVLREPEVGSMYPERWPGGWWRARDIVDYELTAARSLVGLLHRQRERFVRDKITIADRQVRLGREGDPFAFVVPPGQTDEYAAAALLQALRRAGVEVHEVGEGFRAEGRDYPPGTRLVLLAQPYRSHAKDLLEVQRLPAGPRPTGPGGRSYDLAGWTLPLLMGVDVHQIDAPFDTRSAVLLDSVAPRPADVPPAAAAYALDPGSSAAHRAIFEALQVGGSVSFPGAASEGAAARSSGWPVVRGVPDLAGRARRWAGEWGVHVQAPDRPIHGPSLQRLRVALYRPWTASIDEGWTRWVFQEWGVPFDTVGNALVRDGGLDGAFDAVVIPSIPFTELSAGLSGAHPDFAGGLGTPGLAAIRRFVEGGGTLILLGASAELATRGLGLPLRIVEEGDESGEWYARGSILQVEWDRGHPLAAGMPDRGAVMHVDGPAFQVPDGAPVRVFARYSTQGALLSGYARAEERIAGLAAAFEAEVGLGRVIVFGFRPQHRGQTYGTFKPLFNALYRHAWPR